MTVRMGIRVIQRAMAPPSPVAYQPGNEQGRPQDRGKCRLRQDDPIPSTSNGIVAGCSHSTPGEQSQISQSDDAGNASSDDVSKPASLVKIFSLPSQ